MITSWLRTDVDIYSSETDIFSYGMVLYEIFCGKTPFKHFENEEVNLIFYNLLKKLLNTIRRINT